MVSPTTTTLSLPLSLPSPPLSLSLLLLTLRWCLAWFSFPRVTVDGGAVWDDFAHISSIVCAEWIKLNEQTPPPECAAFLAA